MGSVDFKRLNEKKENVRSMVEKHTQLEHTSRDGRIGEKRN
jgi:hypothetical protein